MKVNTSPFRTEYLSKSLFAALDASPESSQLRMAERAAPRPAF
ncbi:hypothetical protein [Bacteroides acidifaciens]